MLKSCSVSIQRRRTCFHAALHEILQLLTLVLLSSHVWTRDAAQSATDGLFLLVGHIATEIMMFVNCFNLHF